MKCLVRSRILLHLTRNNLLSDPQQEYLSKRSTLTNLLCTHHDNLSLINAKQYVDVIFLDFSKAFVVMNHCLLSSLCSLYLPQFANGLCLSWGNCSSRVWIKKAWAAGLQWGPPSLCPRSLLFLIVINDLPAFLTSMYYLFVDNVKLAIPFKGVVILLEDHKQSG